jgi:hypothetical protein
MANTKRWVTNDNVVLVMMGKSILSAHVGRDEEETERQCYTLAG